MLFYFYFDLQEGAEPYMKFYKDSKDMVLFGETLNNFMAYHRADREYKNADIYFLITGLDMVGLATDGSLMKEFSGYAFLSSACTDYKVGMSEDEPKSYDGVHLLTHEIAHLLGCAHDEDPPDATLRGHPGSASCPWNDGYIMSYVINFEHHYTFSHCCVESIRFVSKCVYKLRQCLHVKNSESRVTPHKSLPGFMVTQSQFCRFMHPLYRGVRADKKAKSSLAKCIQKCRSASNRRRGHQSWIHAALDGTQCAKNEKMVCTTRKGTI
ncbi:unnamed protein product [Ixodes hexagonus]